MGGNYGGRVVIERLESGSISISTISVVIPATVGITSAPTIETYLDNILTRVSTNTTLTSVLSRVASETTQTSVLARVATNTTLVSVLGRVATQTTLTSMNSKIPSLEMGRVPVVLGGLAANDVTVIPVEVDEGGSLHVEPVGTGAFGEVITAELDPRVQIDAIYGILDTDHEVLTGTAGGSATASGGLFVCSTGTNVGAYGVIRSRRLIRYKPGQGVRVRFTALYSAPAALGFQHAGLFTAADALTFGYSGTSFGILRRIGGASAIHRLTITVGAGGVETITIKLNDVNFVLPATAGALSTSALAEYIAEATTYTGWSSTVSPQSNGVTVTWIQSTPAATSGAFSLTSTGTASGTFATLQAGSANDDATGFIAQSNWNIDTMDGGDDASNPSGVLLDPTNLNVFEIIYPYLGAGPITFRIMSNDGHFRAVHRVPYANANTIPNQKNPTFRLGWIAASLGSATNLEVRGASAAGFVEGTSKSARDPFSWVTSFSAGTTEFVALVLRVRGEFTGRVNLREILPHTLSVGVETTSRVVRIKCIINPTLTGTVNWQYVDQSRSAVEYATPTNLTPSGGRFVISTISATGTPKEIELHELDLRLEPGDTLAVSLVTVSGSAVCDVSINWQEK